MVQEKIEDLKGRLFYFEDANKFIDFIATKITKGKHFGMGDSYKNSNPTSVCGYDEYSWKIKDHSKYDRICHGYLYKYGGKNIFCSKETFSKNRISFFCEFNNHKVLECPECNYKKYGE